MGRKQQSAKRILPHKPVSRDPRTPVSVTVVKGKYIVRIFDEQAYAENIAQYYGPGEQSSTSSKRPRYIYPKRKQSSRFPWMVPLGDYMRKDVKAQ